MNAFGVAFDHPSFPARLSLTIETWLSFAWAGTGHGLLSVIYTAIGPQSHTIRSKRADYSILLVINALGAWRCYSPAIYRDYRLHYGHEPSTVQLFLFDFLRLGGFFFSRSYLLKQTTKLTWPLLYVVPEPSRLLWVIYQMLLVLLLWNMLPEIVIISPRAFSLPKFMARNTGLMLEVYHEVRKELAAKTIIQSCQQSDILTSGQYQYSPINTPRTIRLLRLELRQGKVSCRLETVALESAPIFWAVSYLWGSEEKPMSLHITDGSGLDVGYIPITKNCASAIEALIPTGVRYLWLDAVSINQSDILEKQQQIPLMGEIYTQAALVAGHLYREDIFGLGLLIHRIIQAVVNETKFNMSKVASPVIYRALGELFKHQYFERAWIVQEIVLANPLILMYGRDCIDLDHLKIIAQGQSKNLIMSGSPVLLAGASSTQLSESNEWMNFTLSIASFRERAAANDTLKSSVIRKNNPTRLTIAQIVDQNLSLGAKNSRDQVYALLSLASDSTIPELQPNYSLEISNKEIFTRISWHYLQDGNHLNLFLSAGIAPGWNPSMQPKRTRGLPSWVYDFETGPNRDLRLGNWAVDVERNRRAGLRCRISPNLEELSVYGTLIDHVAFVASRPARPSEPEFDFAHLSSGVVNHIIAIMDQTWRFTETYVPENYAGGISRKEAYWRTMLMDDFSGERPAPPEAEAVLDMAYDVAKQLLTMRSPPAKSHKALQEMSVKRSQEAINSLTKAFTRIWMAYDLVVLKSGYIGWATNGVQSGDVICLFDGCIVPFVIHPVVAEKKFTLLGDGYVHGFLPGQQPGIEGKPQQWFKVI